MPGTADSLFLWCAGGMLATWMRIKYPHILDGAIAGSAPIWSYFGEVRMTHSREVACSGLSARHRGNLHNL